MKCVSWVFLVVQVGFCNKARRQRNATVARIVNTKTEELSEDVGDLVEETLKNGLVLFPDDGPITKRERERACDQHTSSHQAPQEGTENGSATPRPPESTRPAETPREGPSVAVNRDVIWLVAGRSRRGPQHCRRMRHQHANTRDPLSSASQSISCPSELPWRV